MNKNIWIFFSKTGSSKHYSSYKAQFLLKIIKKKLPKFIYLGFLIFSFNWDTIKKSMPKLVMIVHLISIFRQSLGLHASIHNKKNVFW